MLKKVLATLAVAPAAVDVNKGTRAELAAVTDFGPAIAARILDERKTDRFKGWTDLTDRVKGLVPPATKGHAKHAVNSDAA